MSTLCYNDFRELIMQNKEIIISNREFVMNIIRYYLPEDRAIRISSVPINCLDDLYMELSRFIKTQKETPIEPFDINKLL